MSPLVFVEGVPGSGKSTTAQFLARQLLRHDRPARWFYEEQAPNPFVPEIDPDNYRDWQHFIDLRVERWQAFADEAAASTETLVAESVLLQLPVFTMLRRDAAPAMIEDLLMRLAEVIAPLRPRLVYLAHPRPDDAWRAIAAQRGADFVAGAIRRGGDWAFLQARGLSGLAGVLAYWQAHGALCDRIVARLPMETLTVDVSAGTWPQRRERLCAFLDLDAGEPPAPDHAILAKLTGRYRDGARALTVHLDGERLVLQGILWPSNALLPITRELFDVEAWPFQVRFEENALHWQGPRLWWGGPEGTYRRDPKEMP